MGYGAHVVHDMGWICLIEYVILECDATSMQCGTVQRAIGDLLILTRQVVPNDEHDAAIRRVRIAPRMRFNMCVSSWHQSPTNVLWASIVANRLKPLPSFDQNGMSGGVDGVLCRSLGAFLLCRRGGVSAAMFVFTGHDWSLLTTPLQCYVGSCLG